MQISLWKNFSKRDNSTLRPPDTADAVKTVYLKEGTSQEQPTFIIDEVDWNWSYVKWNDHYYFVTDKIVSTKNVYELQCKQDNLASHIGNILNTTAYIKYAASGYGSTSFNNMIYDSRLSEYISRRQKTTYSDYLIDGNVNYYILNVLNNQSSIVTYYLLTAAQLQTFTTMLFSDNIWQQIILEFSEAIKSIVAIRALPATASMIANMASQGLFAETNPIIYIGKTQMTFQGSSVRAYARLKPDAVLTGGQSVITPWNYDDFRRIDEQIKVYLPCVGIVDVPTANLLDSYSISFNYKLNPTIGRISYVIQANRSDEEGPLPENLIAEYDGEYGYDLPIQMRQTSILSGVTGLMADTLSTAGNIATGNVAALADDTLSFGSDLFKLVDSSPTIIGTLGSATQLYKPRYIAVFAIARNYTTTPSNIWPVFGRPVEKVDLIGNYRGYVQTINASVSGSMNESDRIEINNYLNGGVYIE